MRPRPRRQTHCPPLGVNDDLSDPVHTGWTALADYLRRCRPRYLLHGHAYPREDELVTRVGDTEVVYVSGVQLVELDLPGCAPPGH